MQVIILRYEDEAAGDSFAVELFSNMTALVRWAKANIPDTKIVDLCIERKEVHE